MTKPSRRVLCAWIIIAAVVVPSIADAEACPDGCTCRPRDVVSCTGTGQSAIPKNLPDGTRFLYLEGNEIQILQENCMSRLGQLEEVRLSENRISDIDTGAFNGLPKLMNLFLEDNQISSLNVGVFEPLVQLTELRIGRNRFRVISRDLFGSLPVLDCLKLSNNVGALTIKPGTFEGLYNLTILSLDSSGISQLDLGTFSGLSRLVHLDLSSNNLEYLQRDVFKELSSLLYLKLNSNQRLHTIEANAFDKLLSLLHLNLSDCSLTSISEDVFYGIPELQELHLSANAISDLDNNTFCKMRYILFLELDGNPLTSLNTDSFRCLKFLRNLNLNHTKLTQISKGVFRDLRNIVVISLSNSEIVEIDSDAFSNKPELSRIDIDNNRIKNLAVNLFEGTPNLHTLHIHDNEIQSLVQGMFANITGSLFLTLRGNPLVCDCALDWLASWIQDSEGSIDRCECDQPPALHGLHLDLLTADRFHCEPSITSGPTVYSATNGDTDFILTCPTYGKPPPTMTWMTPTNEEVTQHSSTDLFHLGENGTLVIMKITSEIAGSFSCEARNKLGHIKVQVDLYVETSSTTSWVVPFLVVVSVIILIAVVFLGVTFFTPKRRQRDCWRRGRPSANEFEIGYVSLAAHDTGDSI